MLNVMHQRMCAAPASCIHTFSRLVLGIRWRWSIHTIIEHTLEPGANRDLSMSTVSAESMVGLFLAHGRR